MVVLVYSDLRFRVHVNKQHELPTRQQYDNATTAVVDTTILVAVQRQTTSAK